MWYEDLNILSAIVTVIVTVIIVVVLLFKGKKEEAKKIVLALVIEAESKFGTGTGSVKYAYVLGLIYPKLPIAVRLFITEDTLDNFIEEAVIILKKELQPTVITPVVDSTVTTEAVKSDSKTEVTGTTTIN